MAITTALTRLLDIRHPILLAPMGAVSGGQSGRRGDAGRRAGAIGPRAISARIGSSSSSRPPAMPPWASASSPGIWPSIPSSSRPRWRTSRGSSCSPSAIPRPSFPAIKQTGALCLAQVQSVELAVAAAKAGADIIIAQGSEAGGHGAARGGLALVPAVADAVAPLPVVAAGGIADGRGLAAALALGAAGALMGTRFFASEEALGPLAAQSSGWSRVGATTRCAPRSSTWCASSTGRSPSPGGPWPMTSRGAGTDGRKSSPPGSRPRTPATGRRRAGRRGEPPSSGRARRSISFMPSSRPSAILERIVAEAEACIAGNAPAGDGAAEPMRAAWYERNGPAREVLTVGEMPDPSRRARRGTGARPCLGRQSLRRQITPGRTGAHRLSPCHSPQRRRRASSPPWARASPPRASDSASGSTTPSGSGPSARRRAWWRCPPPWPCRCPMASPSPPAPVSAFPPRRRITPSSPTGPVARKTVLVTGGAGAVGHYAIQLARWGGARVLATVSAEAKAAHALAAGAETAINYRKQDVAKLVLAATGGAGVDRIVEVEFGGNLAIDREDPEDPWRDRRLCLHGRADAGAALLSPDVQGRDDPHRARLSADGGGAGATIADLTRALEQGALRHAVAKSPSLDRDRRSP